MNKSERVGPDERGQPLPDLMVVQFFNPADVQPKGNGVEVGVEGGEAGEQDGPGGFYHFEKDRISLHGVIIERTFDVGNNGLIVGFSLEAT